MFEKELPAHPNLEQYKKQAKDLARDCGLSIAHALVRLQRNHPRFHKLTESELKTARASLTDAQLVIAREHGFESWPKFARHIETLRMIEAVAAITDPVAAFLDVACAPRHTGHGSGTLEHAEMILARYPEVAASSVYTAAILADEAAVRGFLAADPQSATAKGGALGWDALTYLCFSRYLRLDESRSEAFVRTARALLDAGASANTGWIEMIDQPNPRPILESALYGAAGVAKHAGLTRLLLEYGADPNADEETAYHVPEGYDNTVMTILLESGRLNASSLVTMLVRKADWHDVDGLRLLLEHGADPNLMPKFGDNGLQHALRRDNQLRAIEALLEHGANPALRNGRDGRSAAQMAAHRGRGDVLRLFEQRGIDPGLQGVDRLIAACAKDDGAAIESITKEEPQLVHELVAQGGTLLAEFAGTGNTEGVRRLLELGVSANAIFEEGDPYWDAAKGSTALHVAAWRAWPATVKLLIERGAAVNALDGKGRTPLALAVKACVDSYWKDRRTPESVGDLLRAGATVSGVDFPCGYAEVDELLARYG